MGRTFKKEFPTLQKRLRKAGYFTWSYQPLKVPQFYQSGFDEMIWHKTDEVSPLMAPAPKSAMATAKQRPWFGFMRMMDTHYPYMGRKITKEDAVKDYAAACNHLDKFFRHLVKWTLKEYPNTIIVIGSDHGEMLGEQGLWDHLFTLKNPLVHVPLMVYTPDGGVARVRHTLTQHQDITGLILERTGLIDPRQHEERHGLWMAAWGIGHRDPWKHRSLVARMDDRTLQYTVNWHVEHGASFELHVEDNYLDNWFGDNEVSRGLAEAFIEKYPAFPRPNFSLPPERIQGDVDLLGHDAVALGDSLMLGEDGMVEDGSGTVRQEQGSEKERVSAVSLRPTWRDVAIAD